MKGDHTVKHTASYEQWTDPDLPMSEGYHRMSYALYRFDGDVGRVVATRNPDQDSLAEGDYIQDRLELSDEALMYMTDRSYVQPPMFVLTKTGIGILSNRYGLAAGMGLYLHIHTRPDAAARLLNSGALGQGDAAGFRLSRRIRNMGAETAPRDVDAYPALWEAWHMVSSASEPLCKTDGEGNLYLTDLRKGLAKLAAFVGVELTFTLKKPSRGGVPNPRTQVKCYRPLLMEGLLFCLLTELRTYSATRGGVCRFELPEERGRDGLALTLRCPVEPSVDPFAEWSRQLWHSHMTSLGELGGVDVWFPTEPVPSRLDGGLPEWGVMLDQIFDPSPAAASELKARIRLAYGKEERLLPTDDEIPFP